MRKSEFKENILKQVKNSLLKDALQKEAEGNIDEIAQKIRSFINKDIDPSTINELTIYVLFTEFEFKRYEIAELFGYTHPSSISKICLRMKSKILSSVPLKNTLASIIHFLRK